MKNEFKVVELPNGCIFVGKREINYTSLIFNEFNLILIPVFVFFFSFELLLIILVVNYLCYQLYIVEERLMFLSNFGIQIETVSLRGATSYKSIPINNIESLLINEAFLAQEIIFYLLIILKDSKDIILPFKNVRLKIDNLRLIYNTFNNTFKLDN
ncbi:GPI-GlcNAc transferase complex PIG-H component family protein [Theileria parva strain Muguga]|uniref:GPI-GlcNAc transferase complex PIG-H component family protein n=1 Tax=Theileria parva strain Muguga TaxID=333668 RepID=UPI001C61B3E3|nr:GPI-GlcNAc transferase complex PIG-H component family protein [Theileria parva strain Muguga]KAF5153684.1 GPI-GlcNAc transferase complex PIG-H component family protein [Theileria parva strain Muguga]